MPAKRVRVADHPPLNTMVPPHPIPTIRSRADKAAAAGAALAAAAAAPTRCVARPSPAPRAEYNANAAVAPLATGSWATLNVGGIIYKTTLSTLCGEHQPPAPAAADAGSTGASPSAAGPSAPWPALLADAARSGFAGVARDDKGRPFFDRDGGNFRHVLNFLRGYALVVQPQDVAHVTEDARYFGVHRLAAEIGLESQRKKWRFPKGPGVRPDQKGMASSILVAHCGDRRPLPPRRHSVPL